MMFHNGEKYKLLLEATIEHLGHEKWKEELRSIVSRRKKCRYNERKLFQKEIQFTGFDLGKIEYIIDQAMQVCPRSLLNSTKSKPVLSPNR